MVVAAIRRLRMVEEDTRKLNQLAADMPRDKVILQEVLRKKLERRRANARSCRPWWEGKCGINERRAGRLVSLPHSTQYSRAHPRDDTALRMRLRKWAQAWSRVVSWRLQPMLRREGWMVHKKRVPRLSRDEGCWCGRSGDGNGRVSCGFCRRGQRDHRSAGVGISSRIPSLLGDGCGR
ncbi:MAG: hypothetical protein D6690_11380 [Nitrospirae bacterium]|nr:MAG: hypothetical protein D6690_11380 [Nitrospirota bacterium]